MSNDERATPRSTPAYASGTVGEIEQMLKESARGPRAGDTHAGVAGAADMMTLRKATSRWPRIRRRSER